jgi:hypothetical protein
MAEFDILCELTANGRVIEDFKSVEEKEVAHYKQINLMGKTVFGKLTPRYGVTVEYVVPPANEFDWQLLVDGTLVIKDIASGKRTIYSGIYILQEGSAKRDGENEIVKTIDLGAKKRIIE